MEESRVSLAKTAKTPSRAGEKGLNALWIQNFRFFVFLGGLGDLGERYFGFFSAPQLTPESASSQILRTGDDE
jgi:hypothetical protein